MRVRARGGAKLYAYFLSLAQISAQHEQADGALHSRSVSQFSRGVLLAPGGYLHRASRGQYPRRSARLLFPPRYASDGTDLDLSATVRLYKSFSGLAMYRQKKNCNESIVAVPMPIQG
jgi:hypothetical protein